MTTYLTKGQATRERIVRETAPLLNKTGFLCTPLADILRAIGMEKGGFYHHFASKEDLAVEAFMHATEELAAKFADVMQREGGWNLLCKFFDNMGPIPHHLHQSDEFAKLVGQRGKPEAYYFPPQYNLTPNNFPYTFMGLEPGTTTAQLRRCLENWNKGDNGILFHSRAYRLEPGAGWQVNPGILHAPGSLVTYEPQVNSDVFGMFQSMVEGRAVPWDLLVKDVPPEHHHDLDYIIGMQFRRTWVRG